MNMFKNINIMLFSLLFILAPKFAKAQQASLRAEPGVAVPLTDPQAKLFNVGGAVSVKTDIGLGSYFSLGPSGSYMFLPSRVDGVDSGTALSLGGFVRLKRPHDAKNTGTGFGAISPWVDADAGYVVTGPLDRFGWSVATGASVPTGKDREFWVGPFVRYVGVHQDDGKVGVNTNSSKTLVFGLSFELEPHVVTTVTPHAPEPSPPAPEANVHKPQTPTPTPTPDPSPPHPVKMEFKPRIQFAWDSAVIEESQIPVLRDVVSAMLQNTTYKVRIEGHASSEGDVSHNNKLSERRAQSVADFLVANGVDRNRLTVVGFGSRVPVADNSTEAGRVANRRVEFDVTFTLEK
jgi:OOP family OmpA-OmpF porin